MQFLKNKIKPLTFKLWDRKGFKINNLKNNLVSVIFWFKMDLQQEL
jgi:hypothetical protein